MGDIEIMGNQEGFSPEQKLTPEEELLGPSAEETVDQVAEALLKEQEGHYEAGKGSESSGLQIEAGKKRRLKIAIRGFAREFIKKYNKEPNFIQLWEKAKSISG